MKDWQFYESRGEEGIEISKEWGSGYPADPVTKKFLRENMDEVFGFPSIVRLSWKTAENLIEEKGGLISENILIYRASHNYLDWAKYQNRHSSKSV